MRRACRRSMASENSTCMDRIFLKSVLDTHSSVDRKSTPSELQSHSDLVCRLLLEKKNHRTPAIRHANFSTYHGFAPSSQAGLTSRSRTSLTRWRNLSSSGVCMMLRPPVCVLLDE